MASSDPTDIEARRLNALYTLGLLESTALPTLQMVTDATVCALGATWGALVVVHGDRILPKACAGASVAKALRIAPVAAFAVATDSLHVDALSGGAGDCSEFVAAIPVHADTGMAIGALCVCHPLAGALDGAGATTMRAMGRLADLEVAALAPRPAASRSALATAAPQMLGPADCLLVVDSDELVLECLAAQDGPWREVVACARLPLAALGEFGAGAALLPVVRRGLTQEGQSGFEVAVAHNAVVRSVDVRSWAGEGGRTVVYLRDSTDMRQAQMLLLRREAQMHQTEQIASIGGFDVAFPSGAGEFTRHAHRMLDLPPGFGADIWHLLNLITPQARERAMEQLEHAIDGGRLFDIEAPIETPSGRKLLIRLMGLPEYGETGMCDRITGALQDITAARAAELESQARAGTLHAIALAQSEMLMTGNAEVALNALLQAALHATDSEAGFVGMTAPTANGTQSLTTRGWVFGGAADGERSVTPISGFADTQVHACSALLGHPLTTDAPVFVNDNEDEALGADLPPGSGAIRHLLAIPFAVAGETAGFLVLANRRAGYYPRVAQAMEPVVQTCASVVANLRADAAREAATVLARDAEALWRTLFEMQVDGIVTCDEVGLIESMNPAAERVFGFSPGAWHGLNVSALMPQEIARIHDSFLRRHTEAQLTTVLGATRELQGVRTDGSLFPLELSLSAYHHGDKYRFAGVVRDVSVRKALEAELRKRQELLEASEEIAHLGSWSLDLRTGAVEGSDEFFRVIGVAKEPPPTQDTLHTAIHPDDLSRFIEAYTLAVESDTPMNLGYRNLMPDGSVRDCHVRAQLVRDEHGEPHFLRGATQDVTELRTIERELRERESFLRRLTDTAEEAIWASTLEGVTTVANPKYLELMGKSAEEVIGKPVFSHVLPGAADGIRAALARRADGIR